MNRKFTSEEEFKDKQKEITNNFQRKRREAELDNNRRTKVIFFGNSGVGKSTLASISVHPEESFDIGVDENGFTKGFNEKQHPTHPYTIIDSPALVGSIEKKDRKDLGLQKDGKYKIIFVATTTQSDLRLEDSTALTHITKLINEISPESEISLIVNKVPESLISQQKWENCIPEIPGIDGDSDLESEIGDQTLKNIKKVLERAIEKCPVTLFSRTKMESRNLNDTKKENEPTNGAKKKTSDSYEFSGAKDNSKKKIEPPNHEEIESFPQKKVKFNPQDELNRFKEKIEKRTLHSEVAEKESKMIEEAIHDSDDYQKEDGKRRQNKHTLMPEQYEYDNKMPRCFEKSLVQILALLQKQVSPNTQVLQRVVSELENQLATEKFNERVLNKFNAFRNELEKRDFKAAARELNELLKLVRPLDINEVVRLTKKATEAGKILKGKKILLLVGDTGAGKSTTIHYLCGSTLIETELNGLPHLAPTNVKHSDLRNVTTTPEARSETRYITTVALDDGYVLCDTPGFGDTNGAEVDIAGGVGVVQAIRQCQEVKPILVTNFKDTGAKWQGLKKLARTLAMMLPGFQENMKSISYFFTKFPEKEKNALKSSIESVKKNMTVQDKANLDFVKFFDDLLTKAVKAEKKKSVDITFIEPLNEDKAEDILSELKDGQFIQYPADKFRTYITQDSRAVLDKQLAAHKDSIAEGLKRRDYKFIDFRLSELSSLYEAIGDDNINQQYKDAVIKIVEQFNEEYTSMSKTLKRQFAPHNELTKEDIQNFIEVIESLENAQSLRENHLKGEVDTVQAGTYYQFLAKQTSELVDNFIKEFSNLSKNFGHFQTILVKIELIASVCKNQDPMNELQKVLNFLDLKIKESWKIFEENLAKEAYDDVAAQLIELHQLSELASPYLKSFDYQALLDQTVKVLKNETSKRIQQQLSSSQLLQGRDQTEKLKTIVDWSEKLVLAEQSFNNPQYHPCKEIKEVSEEFFSQICVCAQSVENEIKSQFSRQVSEISEDVFAKLERPFRVIGELKEIPRISAKLQSIYWSTLDAITSELKNSKRTAQNIIKNMYHSSNEREDGEDLKKYLKNLETAKWVDEFANPPVCENVSTEIKEKIRSYAESIEKILSKVEFVSDNYKWLNEVSSIFSKIKMLEPLKTEIDNLGDVFKKTSERVKKISSEILGDIKEEFNKEKLQNMRPGLLDTQKAEGAVIALKLIQEWDEGSEYRTARTILIEYLSEYSMKIKHYFEELLTLKESLKADADKVPEDSIPSDGDSFDSFPLKFKPLENNLSELKARVKNMTKYIKELKSIEEEEQYSNLKNNYFKGDLIREFLTEIDEIRGELAMEVNELLTHKNAIGKLKTMLQMIQNLKGFDEVIKGDLFSQLYKETLTNFKEFAGEYKEEAINDIKTDDIESGVEKMKEIEKTSPQLFLRIKKFLADHITNLVSDIQEKLDDLQLKNLQTPMKEVKQISERLKLLERAKDCIPKDYLSPSLHGKIDECLDLVKSDIFAKIERYFNGLEAFAKCNSYSLVSEKLDFIEKVGTNFFKHQLTKENRESLQTKISEYRKKGAQNIIEDYQKRDLTEYALFPPIKLFDKSSDSVTDDQYRLSDIILEKCRNELESATLGSLDGNNSGFAKVEDTLQYLPENLRTIVQRELKNRRKDVQTQADTFEQKFNNIQKGNVSQIHGLYMECEKSGIKEAIQRTMKFVIQQIELLKMELESSLGSWEDETVFRLLQNLFEYKNFFRSNNEFRRQAIGIIGSILRTLESQFNHLFTTLSKTFSTEAEVDSPEILSKKVGCLIAFKKFRAYTKERKMDILDDPSDNIMELAEDLLPKDFDVKCEDLSSTISKFLVQKIKYFKEFFNAHDSLSGASDSSLSNTIESVQRWDYFFLYLRNKQHSVFVLELCNIQDLPTSAEVTKKLTDLISKMRKGIINASSMNPDIVLLQEERNRAFIQLNSSLAFIKNAAKIRLKLDFDPESIYRECAEALKERFIQVNRKASGHLKKFLAAPSNSSKQEAEKFNQCYQLLHSFEKQIKIQAEPPQIEDFESSIIAKLREYDIESFVRAGNLPKLTENLKKVKLISNLLFSFKEMINKFLDEMLDGIRTQTNGSSILSNLGALLNTDEVGQSIVSEHKSFDGFCLSLFNKKIQTQGIDYVLEFLRCNDKMDKNILEKRYNSYEEKYQQLVQKHIGATVDFGQIISQMNMLIGSGIPINEEGKIEWDQSNSDKIPEILANIFAIWTLLNASHYLEATDSKDRQSYLFQPHPAQIISIFRIFSVGDETSALRNNLVQIGTGEGKSLILAGVSSIFALLGFDVSCACYSEYLSRRDYNAFQKLFDILNIKSYIQYGTFNKLCENFINQDGDIRKIVETIVSNGPKPENEKKAKRPKILLIDEVDVFFKKDFYGNTYTPSASLKDNTITKLITYIWANRNSSITTESVIKSQEFQDCCATYKAWEDLIQEAVKDMNSEVKVFESHDYVVQNDQIGYKEQDGISFNISYGYQTLFAYFREFENKTISQESRDENICIRLKCGHFSYAEMPKGFNFIMGVTGTLETLSPIERKMIADTYKISKFTYTPSVFGKNNLKFSKSDDILIEQESDYFNTIVREINNRLIGGSGSRAVLVVFESEEKLIEFRDSKAFSSLKGSSRYLTEKANMQEKEFFVKQATNSGSVSLLTRSFGRGTDFVCLDPIVEANGGVHVIQAFLSEEISEEVQIRGRTARQGDRGSYSMVLLDQSLEKFMITREQVNDMIARSGSFWEWLKGKSKTIYDHLNESRYEVYKTKYVDSSRFVEEAGKSHDEGLIFIKNLHNHNAKFVKEFLLKLNKGAEDIISSRLSRTLCLMDATGSMFHLLHKAKNAVGIMWQRALDVMSQHLISSNSFQMQFAVYRNYDCKEDKILQVSTWEAQPENLKGFMDKIEPEGGYGEHEAVEIGLWHAYQEAQKNNISQIILIGDAPPNTIDEVEEKRRLRKNVYWNTTKFNVPTHWKEQVQNLKRIPIHAFYVVDYAKGAFNEIANMSGGQCKKLDVNSAEGAALLTDCVTETILKNVGELAGKGDQLVNDYKKKYTKSFS